MCFDERKKTYKHAKSYIAASAYIIILGYLLYTKYGTDSSNESVNDYLTYVQGIIVRIDPSKKAIPKEEYEGVKIAKSVIPKDILAIIRNLKTTTDISCIMELMSNEVLDGNFTTLRPELYNCMKSYYYSNSENQSNMDRVISLVMIAISSMLRYGIYMIGAYDHISLTKAEQDYLIDYLVRCGTDFETGEQIRQVDYLTEYVIGLMFILLSKEINSMKEFYFKNNSETQYLELQRLENTITNKNIELEKLKSELDMAHKQQTQQKEEIRQLIGEAYKENKDAIRPYVSEISELSRRIKELEVALEGEREKTPELNALREFAFTIQTQSEYIPEDGTTSLTELIAGKKVIIVGGHINWRNKMKNLYPAIQFIDGHNKSIDASAFENADFILFNVSNMAHAVYEKVMSSIRNKDLKFDYLGRTKNVDLLEDEIATILQKKM